MDSEMQSSEMEEMMLRDHEMERLLEIHSAFQDAVRISSEISNNDELSGLVDLWRGQGGPPVPTCSSRTVPLNLYASQQQADVYDQGNYGRKGVWLDERKNAWKDKDDDEQADKNFGIKFEELSKSAKHTNEKDHTQGFYPSIGYTAAGGTTKLNVPLGETDNDEVFLDWPSGLKITSQITIQFACPFFKKDPSRYHLCGSRTFAGIRGVMFHINFEHPHQLHCPSCLRTFKAKDAEVRHSDFCNFPVVTYDGVTEAQNNRMKNQIKISTDQFDQWFTIFDILFPKHEPRPDSCYPNEPALSDWTGFIDPATYEVPKVLGRNPVSATTQDEYHLNQEDHDPLGALPLDIRYVGQFSMDLRSPQYNQNYWQGCDDTVAGVGRYLEPRRHRVRQDKNWAKRWICIQPSGQEHLAPTYPLSKCKACTEQRKRYNAYSNAAAHLRRVHFRSKIKGVGTSKSNIDDSLNKSGGKAAANWPEISELKHWIAQLEEQTAELNHLCPRYEAHLSDNDKFHESWPSINLNLQFENSIYETSPSFYQPIESWGSSAYVKESEGADIESVAPFTDSGYKSAPNIGYPPKVQADQNQALSSPQDNLAMSDNEVDETKTQYSIGSTADPDNARKCIADIASDMFGKLRLYGFGVKDSAVFSQVLPDLLKAFAFKICDDRNSQENRNLMHFIHKRHREIGKQLEATFYCDNVEEPDHDRGHSEDMAVHDKMEMWQSKATQESSTFLKDELFEGVEDDVEDLIDDSELSRHCTTILKSPAYKWFISTLAKESILQLDTSQPRIRQCILNTLPSGTVSKRRTPDTHQVTIDLEWHLLMEERLRLELLGDLDSPTQPYNPSIIITGSQEAAQGLDIKQYLGQTWPITGLKLLYALKTSMDSAPQSLVINIGNVKLDIKVFRSHLTVTVTGPSYFVADFCELLAWTGSALLSSDRAAGSHCLPSITNFRVDTSLSNLPSSNSPKHCFSCSIKFNLQKMDTWDKSPLQVQYFRREFLKSSTLVLGFPIRKRPEGYPGLELTFETMMDYLGTTQNRILPPYFCIKGRTGRLLLIKHKEGIFLWRFDNPSTGHFSSLPDYDTHLNVEINHASIDYSVLVGGRHIICEHTSDDNPAEAPRQIPEAIALVDSRKSRSCFPAQADPAHNLQFSHTGNHPSISYTENSVAAESPSNESYSLSTDCRPSPATESSEVSFDSDMFSISDSADSFEAIDLPLAAYPLINEITRELVAGFRTSTQYQSCPRNGRENSRHDASTTTSSSSGTFPRLCNKRESPQDNNDSAGEDGSSPYRPKRSKSDLGKDQKYFACPYWKKDAIKYRDCFKCWPTRVQDVKYHLIRKHTVEFYCQKCHASNFRDTQDLDAHVMDDSCSPKQTLLDWISHEKRNKLHKKSKRGMREVDQWFSIWDILFPGQEKPLSAYIDTGVVQRGCEYSNYSTIHGPAVIARIIESSPVWQSLNMTEEERQESLQRAIAEGFMELYEGWRSETRSQESSTRSQDSQYESPANSMVDSAVVMTASTSSEGAMSQRGNMDLSGHQIGASNDRSPTLLPSMNPTSIPIQSIPSDSSSSLTEGHLPDFEHGIARLQGQGASQWQDWEIEGMEAPDCDLEQDLNDFDRFFDDTGSHV